MFEELPVQVDGEPWLQPAGHVVVLRSALKVCTFGASIASSCRDQQSLNVSNISRTAL